MSLSGQMSAIYQKWLPKELLGLKLNETKATCDNCAMQKGLHKGPKFYDPKLKCCTYEPFLPNYLVGLALQDEVPAKAALHEKIKKRQYALPIGMLPSVRFQVEFNEKKEKDFGLREDWLCPYYDHQKQNCGVWAYRGSVCTSFYCKSSYGKDGLEFWQSLGDFLHYVEMSLAEEALVHLDFSPRQVVELSSYINRKEGSNTELSRQSLPEAKAKKLWNGYFEDQIGFYQKCAKLIQSLSKKDFEEALGEMGQRSLEHLQSRANKLKPKL